MRKKNLNLELRLFPLSNSDLQPHLQPLMKEEVSESPLQRDHQHQQRHQPLTIFYDGKTCVRDVTELQARTILMLANKEMEERVRTPTGSEPSSPALPSHPTGLSMKKSLQRFLQKRKNRIQEASPYTLS